MTPAPDIVPAAHREATAPIPGAREAGMLTTFAPFAASTEIIADGGSTMDAATTAERRREGGGAPNQRRPARKRVAPRALWAWRFGTQHV